MSALATVAGMFPPVGDEIWNPNVDWQPISVHTTPKEIEYRLSLKKRCARYIHAALKYANETNYEAFIDRHRALINILEENAGFKLPQLWRMLHLYDRFDIERLKGKRYDRKKQFKRLFYQHSEFIIFPNV